ncbi:hypothetical protein SprV_0301347900 [Sparganum proliferum]
MAAGGCRLNHIGTVSLDVTLPQNTTSHTFIVTPKLTWDLVLGVDLLARQGCQIDVKQRTVQFCTKKEEKPMTPAAFFDDAAICAAIQTSVQLPPTSVNDILSKVGGTDRDRRALKAPLLDFEDVFAWDKYSLGRKNRIRHSIETGSAKPIWPPPRRIPVQYQNEVCDLLDSMLATGDALHVVAANPLLRVISSGFTSNSLSGMQTSASLEHYKDQSVWIDLTPAEVVRHYDRSGT